MSPNYKKIRNFDSTTSENEMILNEKSIEYSKQSIGL